MNYTALKTMKVQNSAGQIEIRKPGDKVPEALTWPNVNVYIKRGFLEADDQQSANAAVYTRKKIKPAVVADENAKNRSISKPPVSGQPLGSDKSSEDSDLTSMSRKDLNTYAKENHGVENPEKYPTKKALIEAFE